MDEFSSAEELVAFRSAHFPVRSDAENLVFEELDALETDSSVTWRWIHSHVFLFESIKVSRDPGMIAQFA